MEFGNVMERVRKRRERVTAARHVNLYIDACRANLTESAKRNVNAAWCSTQISKRLDCCERQVRRLIRNLSDLGLVVTIRQSGKANRYAVALPEPEPYLQPVEYALQCDVAQALEQYGVDALEAALRDEAVEIRFISENPGHIAA